MNHSLDNQKNKPPAVAQACEPHEFSVKKTVIGVLIMMLLISAFAQHYASQITLPRFCKAPQQSLYYLKKILTEERPAGEEARRPYIIAAKLIFLVPQKTDESLADYLLRVELSLQQHCQ